MMVLQDLEPDLRRSPQLPLAESASIVSETFSKRQLSAHAQYNESPISSRAASPSFHLSRSPSPFLSQPTGKLLPYENLIPVMAPPSTSAVTSGVALGDNNAKLPPSLKKKFMECSVDELSIREVGELLSEYRRIVERVSELDRFSAQGDSTIIRGK